MEELFFTILAILVVGIALVSWFGGIGFLIVAVLAVAILYFYLKLTFLQPNFFPA